MTKPTACTVTQSFGDHEVGACLTGEDAIAALRDFPMNVVRVIDHERPSVEEMAEAREAAKTKGATADQKSAS